MSNSGNNQENQMEEQLQQLSLRSGSPLPTLMGSSNDITATLTPMQASPIAAAAASPDRPSNNNNNTQRRQAPIFATRHHELTPVTRNTSFLETSNPIVSPDDDQGDRLSLPSADQFADSTSRHHHNHHRPPLAQRRSNNSLLAFPTIPIDKRALSLTNINDMAEEEEYEVDDEDDWVVTTTTNGCPPVDFPSRDKFYSFNSRHQYKDQACNNKNNIGRVNRLNVTPYQPTRQDLGDVGALPEEELSLIFNNRDGDAQAPPPPSLLQTQIPLGERQWSIPSIRMANALTEYSGTDFTDEEDDLDDNASLSSRGSSLYLPEDYADGHAQVVRFTPTAGKPIVIFEGELPDIPLAPSTSFNAVATKRRRSDDDDDDDDAPFAWLKSVEQQAQGGEQMICEAASSKFLCKSTKPTVLRQKSSPLY